MESITQNTVHLCTSMKVLFVSKMEHNNCNRLPAVTVMIFVFPDRGDKEDEDRRPSGPFHGPWPPESPGSPGEAARILSGGGEGGGQAGVRRETGGQER